MMLTILQLYSFAITIAIGLISASFAYFLFRKHSVLLWGYTAGALPDAPSALNFLGITNTYTLLVVTHVFGVFLITGLLIVVDILLVELRIIRYFSPLGSVIKQLKPLIIAEKVARKLENYNMIPTPERLQTVYTVSIVSIIIHLSINLILGVI